MRSAQHVRNYEYAVQCSKQGSPHRSTYWLHEYTLLLGRSRTVSRRCAAHLREPYLTLDFVAFSCCRDWRLGLPALAVALGAAASKNASGLRPL